MVNLFFLAFYSFLIVKSICNIIESYETGKVSLFEIFETYNYNFFHPIKKTRVNVSFITGFEECYVYTKKGTILTALKKLVGQTTFPIAFELEGKRLGRAETEIVVTNLVYDNSYNCHGFTFLNGQYWFLLNQAQLDLLVLENQYIPCTKSSLKEGGICIYYNFENQLIHSAKVLDGIIQSKFGVNTIITRGEQEILDKYEGAGIDETKTLYYNLD